MLCSVQASSYRSPSSERQRQPNNRTELKQNREYARQQQTQRFAWGTGQQHHGNEFIFLLSATNIDGVDMNSIRMSIETHRKAILSEIPEPNCEQTKN